MADADVLLAAYDKWQQQLLDHLLGDFAFAIWDKERQSLFLARDHMGRRTLFYHQDHGWFAFASMPAELLALPEIPMAPDEERVRDLLLLLRDSSEHSYFAGIKRLLPGHYALLRADGTFSSRLTGNLRQKNAFTSSQMMTMSRLSRKYSKRPYAAVSAPQE